MEESADNPTWYHKEDDWKEEIKTRKQEEKIQC